MQKNLVCFSSPVERWRQITSNFIECWCSTIPFVDTALQNHQQRVILLLRFWWQILAHKTPGLSLKEGVVTDNQKRKVSQGLWDHTENRKKRLMSTMNNRQFCKKLRTQQRVRKDTTWCTLWWSLWYWVSLTLPGRIGGESLQETYGGELHGSPLYFRWIFQITLWRENLKEKTTGRKNSLESLH